MQLEIIDVDAKCARLALSGRLDTPGVDSIETRFAASATTAGKHVIVDLSEVSILTSMGIRMLISTARAINNKKHRMVIVGARDVVSETLEHASLNEIIPVLPDESRALAMLS